MTFDHAPPRFTALLALGLASTLACADDAAVLRDLEGSFIISSENRDKAVGKNTTAQGRWHISDDGHYCMLIELRVSPTEEWCRCVVKSGADYNATKSDKHATEKVYKLSISK